MSMIIREAAPLAALLALYVAHALSLWRRLRASQTESRLLRERIDEMLERGRLNHLYPLQTLVYKPSALCAVPLPVPQIVPAGGTLAGPAAFVMLEQAILSGQLDARQVEAEFSADPQFRDWFQARATARQEAA